MAINGVGYYLGVTEANRCHINQYTFYYQRFFSGRPFSQKLKLLQVQLPSALPSNSNSGWLRAAQFGESNQRALARLAETEFTQLLQPTWETTPMCMPRSVRIPIQHR
jgi:hypothetical protein